MKKSKVRTLLMSCVMIMLCAAMIVGGTYALWSDSVKVENHLTAGTLKVKLERTSLTRTYLDEDGYLATSAPDATPVDFTTATSANVFGLTSDEKIVPCQWFEAKMKITNSGDVAFTYDVIIKLTSESNALAEQLEVTVKDGDDEQTFKLSECASNDGKYVISSSMVAKNTVFKEFTVKLEFVNNNAVNNSAQAKSASFDLLVNAVQKTSAD